ncbi:AraC family transcriptional regulator [Lactiplantibacillus pentosus]|uniref:AraC family transcriptional regulator n=1 Tax=Lactiplantibacillus pentosus TaxID=1589 RepID=UPI001330765E|nr:AraC family transcriptional regulator [Lactiplantibacillus pentosus]MBQ0835056.1 AraC family transcriptional regulator [Lactiplantibacillus pentosus]MBU7463477.1 AraC family transcriptional regulator [Lactiplantibacillus pentosus]MBU7490505.1 AraC family transcriptional regulator [Lactiplantibacillus pentosus]MBU7493054.1 AraC family transcriptional regulator [Lactiplantibacillus pentosus]MBU7519061.1 AraC family transcriptional regulator [Lactiplantibacillus pentosus]
MLSLSAFEPEVLYAFPFRNQQPGTYVYHQHDFLELSIMVTGYSDYNVEGQWRRVVAGQALLFNPGIHHQETQPPNSESLQLHIGFRHIALPGQPPNHMPFSDSLINLGEYRAEFMANARRIIAENQRPTVFGHGLLTQTMVVEQLCWLLRSLPDNKVSNDYAGKQGQSNNVDQTALVNATTYYLNAHYQEELTLGDVAATLHVSAAYLSRAFKAVKGETPSAYLMKLRLQQARTLLEKGGLSVNAVARTVGYQDPYYFSKLFKRYFGVTPTMMKNEA